MSKMDRARLYNTIREMRNIPELQDRVRTINMTNVYVFLQKEYDAKVLRKQPAWRATRNTATQADVDVIRILMSSGNDIKDRLSDISLLLLLSPSAVLLILMELYPYTSPDVWNIAEPYLATHHVSRYALYKSLMHLAKYHEDRGNALLAGFIRAIIPMEDRDRYRDTAIRKHAYQSTDPYAIAADLEVLRLAVVQCGPERLTVTKLISMTGFTEVYLRKLLVSGPYIGGAPHPEDAIIRIRRTYDRARP